MSAIDRDWKKSMTPEHNCEEFNIDDPKLRCGVGRYRPSWLQRLADIKVFLIVYSVAAMVSSSLNIYIISQITVLQKLFGLSSRHTGFLISANDAGYMAVSIFASHFSRRAHKPLIIGVLGIVFGIAAMISSTPHLLLESYPGLFYFNPDHEQPASGQINTTQMSAAICNATRLSESTSETKADNDARDWVQRTSFGLMAACLVVMGAVKSPRVPLSLTYFDDHVPKTKAGLYMGISIAIILLGLVVATGLGASFSQIYVTLEDVSLSVRDPRWVGAWWLGFVVIGSAACVLAAPLLCFPKYLKTNTKFKKDDSEKALALEQLDVADGAASKLNTQDDEILDLMSQSEKQPTRDEITVAKLAKEELKDFPRAIWRLLTNPMYVCILIANILVVMGIMGRLVYFPKYLEVHFNMLPYNANFMFGTTILIGSAIGSIASGVLMAVFKMPPRTFLIFSIVLGVVSSLSVFIGLPLHCQQARYNGFNMTRLKFQNGVSPFADDREHNTSCSDACVCLDSDFLPICGDDGLTYFSPCHAGCTVLSHSATTFSNCGCMSEASNGTAVSGSCDYECDQLVTYLVFAFIGPMIGLLTMTPKMVVKIRSVDPVDRTLALGLDGFSALLFGSFVAPILFGEIIDSTCTLWISGYCRVYSIADFRFRFHVAIGLLMLASDFMYGLSLLSLYLNKRRWSELSKP